MTFVDRVERCPGCTSCVEKDQRIADLQAKLEAAERERDALRAKEGELETVYEGLRNAH